jgi:hypothetical protein
MFVVPFRLFVIAKGGEYPVAPAYPMLYAAGSLQFFAFCFQRQFAFSKGESDIKVLGFG